MRRLRPQHMTRETYRTKRGLRRVHYYAQLKDSFGNLSNSTDSIMPVSPSSPGRTVASLR
ncbi:MAG TPA: hypothetical protein VGK65_08530 [Candidatus Binatia bacterium]